MYEFLNGTARVIDAMERAAADPERLKYLANVLYYCEDQLAQDIAAAADYYDRFRDQATAEANE